jgi:hypothetical protein
MLFSGWRTYRIYKMRKINPLKKYNTNTTTNNNIVTEQKEERVKAENKGQQQPTKKNKYWRPAIIKNTRNISKQLLALRYADSSEFSI